MFTPAAIIVFNAIILVDLQQYSRLTDIEYKKIIEKLREEKREQNVEMLRSYPDLESYLEDPDKMFAFILNCNGRQYPISAKFPKKKGNIDDIFIFQKNIKKSKKINLQI